MQICYRCEEKTNQLLEKLARKNKVSKNHLIDEIIKDYLREEETNTQKNNPDFQSFYIKAKLLPAIQYANELLAQLLEEMGRISSCIGYESPSNADRTTDNHTGAYTNKNADTDTYTNKSINTTILVESLSFPSFYAHVIHFLLEISETLASIRKKITTI